MPSAISFVRIGKQERAGRARFAVLLGVVSAFAVYKALCVGAGRASELTLSILFDATMWGLLWAVSEALASLRTKGAEWLAGVVFYPLLYASGGLVFAHTWFYDAAIERRLTVLDVTGNGIVYFFTGALPRPGFWALAALLLGMHSIAYLAYVNVRRVAPRHAAYALLPLCLLTALWSSRAPRTTSVLFDSGQELWQLARLPTVTPQSSPRSATLLPRLDRSAAMRTNARPEQVPFRKVIVLVMETMTERKWRDESKALPPSTFVHAQRAHTHRYRRYFPNNQDSRTGMLNMLASQVIPYEAYNDADVAAYQGMSARESLVDRFRERGYKTAFVVAQEAIEEVVTDLPWDAQLNLSKQDIAAVENQLLCFAPDEWENGCEDLAVLPKLVDFVKTHDRAFVYQEFIWGHDSAYNRASGKTNTAYYSGYVDQLLKRLDEAGLADDTLIALTSDHGFRDKSQQRELWVYEIPLLFHARRFQAQEDARLFSHVDFKELLLHQFTDTANALPESPLVMIVGPTGSGMVTSITRGGDFSLLRRRGSSWRLLEQRTSSTEAPSAAELLGLFERHRAQFDARLR